MVFEFGQAIYGERDRGHQLLASSSLFPDAARLAGRMDMQGSPPPHTSWEPYLSGFAWNKHYVLARTMPDVAAARAGMVFSRAFALPLAVAEGLEDIASLLDMLEALGDDRSEVVDLEGRPGPRSVPARAGLARAMLEEGEGPVVWPGESGFDAALANLWANLWPAARRSLSFRIAFSPTDIASDPPAIVTTPQALVSRWSGFRIANPDAAPNPKDLAEAYLLGDRTVPMLSGAVDAFGEQMADVATLRQAGGVLAMAENGGSLADIVDALRLASHLAPQASQGAELKSGLVERAAMAAERASVDEVRMARNLDLAAVAGRQTFWRALRGWAETGLWQESDSGALAQVIDEAFSTRGLAEWREAMAAGISRAVGGKRNDVSAALWRALGARPSILTTIGGPDAGRRKILEQTLLRSCPKSIPLKQAEAIAVQALNAQLVSVHAACCAASMPPQEAMRRHLAEAHADEHSLAIAARKASGADRVAVALENDDPVSLALAASQAAKDPALLRNLDVHDLRWRALWSAAMRISPKAISGPAESALTVAAFFDGLINGAIDDDELVEAISRTDRADLTSYPSRSQLWASVRQPALDRFLTATADAAIVKLERGEDIPIDDVLAGWIVEPLRLDPVLVRLTANVEIGVSLFRILSRLDEARFQRWLQSALSRGRPMSAAEAEAVGRLVAARNWTRIANGLADAIIDHGRGDLNGAIDYIVEMIGMIRRYYLDESGSRTPDAAKWQILEELVLELYGYGPQDGALWRRSGGKDGDVPKGRTGGDVWRKALADARKGKGAIDVSRLLGTMATDYPRNATLSKLRYDPLFRKGWR
jgi:hypothetical protein